MTVVKEKKTPRPGSAENRETKGAKRETPKRPARADSIVTARVPTEIKEQGDAVLKKIGATPTELVNAAYAHVVQYGELPKTAPSLEELKGKHRVLTPEQKKMVKDRMRAMTLKAPADWGDRTFKELLAEARDERYARFA